MQVLTTIVIDSEPHGNVYVIVCVPGPATEGENKPVVALTPGPLNVPPAEPTTKVNGASVAQKDCG